jgi:hypothetical protein
MMSDPRISQSRYANSLIKTKSQFDEPLHTVVNQKGEPSPSFPKTVNELLGLSGTHLVLTTVRACDANYLDMQSVTFKR